MLLLEEKTWSYNPPSKWAHFPIMKIDLICFVISTDLDLINIQVKYSTSWSFRKAGGKKSKVQAWVRLAPLATPIKQKQPTHSLPVTLLIFFLHYTFPMLIIHYYVKCQKSAIIYYYQLINIEKKRHPHARNSNWT